MPSIDVYNVEGKKVKSIDLKEEIFGIVGLSGSGKTTTTRMLMGLTEPSSGGIQIKLGDEWIDMTKGGPLNRGRIMPYIGLLHQEYSLYPHRTILGNLTDAISLNFPAEFAKIKACSSAIPTSIKLFGCFILNLVNLLPVSIAGVITTKSLL